MGGGALGTGSFRAPPVLLQRTITFLSPRAFSPARSVRNYVLARQSDLVSVPLPQLPVVRTSARGFFISDRLLRHQGPLQVCTVWRPAQPTC